MIRTVSRRSGLSFLELVVVIAIILVLLALLFPALHKVREVSNRNQCSNNLKQLLLATHNYASDYQDALPPMYQHGDIWGENGVTWSTLLLPYVGEQAIWSNCIASGSALGQGNVTVRRFNCPSDPTNPAGYGQMALPGWAPQNYGANWQLFGSASGSANGVRSKSGWAQQSPYTICNIPDGTSNTVFYAERAASFPRDGYSSTWAYPSCDWFGWQNGAVIGYWSSAPPQFDPTPENTLYIVPQSFHPGTCHVGMGDGAVRSISSTISQKVWWEAVIPYDGWIGCDW